MNNLTKVVTMRKLKYVSLLIFFLLIPSIQGFDEANRFKILEATKKEEFTAIIQFQSRAKFLPAFERIKKYEGYYVNHPHDHGKETYQGITRRFNPEWTGWKYIDLHKKEFGRPKTNEKLNDLVNHYVLDYYLTLWLDEGFDKIKSQGSANYFFDFRINGGISVIITRRMLNRMGCKIEGNTSVVNEELINAINSIDPKIFVIALKNERMAFYNGIVKRDATQKIFYRAWKMRTMDIENINS